MKSSKWIFGLMSLALVLAMAQGSFAQTLISLTSAPSAAEVQTDHQAQTADPTTIDNGITVSGQFFATANLTATVLTLTYPGPITSSTSVPAADPIQIVGATGMFGSVAIGTVNNSAGTIQITLPPVTGTDTTTGTGSFRLVGVRVDVNGLTAPLTASWALSTLANNYAYETTNAPVALISALSAGIGSFTQGAISGQTNNGAALIFTNGTIPGSKASLLITEGCATCWRSATQYSVSGNPVDNGTEIRVTISGLPSGVTANIGTIDSSGTTAYSVSSTALKAATTSSPTNNQTLIQITNSDLTKVEQIQLNITLSGTPSGTLTPGTITATATLAPIATSGLTTATPALPTEGSGYPTFTEADLGPVTIGSIAAANTTLLVPYAVAVGAYDTGIEIANTTADPFAATGAGASPTNGTLEFWIYPLNSTYNGAGTVVNFTTSATVHPGQGLDASGMLDAGAVWSANFGGDILKSQGMTVPTGGMFAYVFIQANFLNAHGISLVYNGTGVSYGAPLLVLPPPSQGNSRTTPGNGVESLGN